MLVTCAIPDHPAGVSHFGQSILSISISLLMITGMTADFDIYLAYQRNVQNVSVNILFFVYFDQ